MKKSLAVLLSVIMALSVLTGLPIISFADGENTITDISISNIWDDFVQLKPVYSTTQLSAESAKQMSLERDYWLGSDGCEVDKDNWQWLVTADVSYDYNIVLNANDGYVFADKIVLCVDGEETACTYELSGDATQLTINNFRTVTAVLRTEYFIREDLSIMGEIYDNRTGLTHYYKGIEGGEFLSFTQKVDEDIIFGDIVQSDSITEAESSLLSWAEELGVTEDEMELLHEFYPEDTFYTYTDQWTSDKFTLYYGDELVPAEEGDTVTRFDYHLISLTGAYTSIPHGFETIDGVTKYYDENANAVTGWQKIDNKWYYFDADGVMQTGLITVNGKNYLLDNTGVMLTGLQSFEGEFYYFDASGAAVTGWQKADGYWYYFDTASNKALAGWQKIKNVWYYFDDSGVMQTGWQKIDNKWYYFKSGGAMVTGWQKISNKWYYFKSGGAMVTGWQKISNKWYYFKSGGAMQTGWLKDGGKWYYFQSGGAMQTGWLKLSGKWYYFNSSGVMQTVTQRINGKIYRFNSSGVCLNP